MSFHIIGAPKCDLCGEVGEAEDLGNYLSVKAMLVALDILIRNPRFPSGWQTVNGRMVCPKHEIKIEDRK